VCQIIPGAAGSLEAPPPQPSTEFLPSQSGSISDVPLTSTSSLLNANGNLLIFRPPGFHQKLSVQFPDCRLPVCYRCKKNYKTRDTCRLRNRHTELPWSTSYLCITIDDTCFDITPAGKKVLCKEPMMTRVLPWQPFCSKKDMDEAMPVCAACKHKNYTKAFCRKRHKHRQLPWSTVYLQVFCNRPKPRMPELIKDNMKSGDATYVPARQEVRVELNDKKSDASSEVSKPRGVNDEESEEEKQDEDVTKKDADQDIDNKGTKNRNDSKKERSLDTPALHWREARWVSDPVHRGESIEDMDETTQTFLIEVSHHELKMQWLDLNAIKGIATTQSSISHLRNALPKNPIASNPYPSQASNNYQDQPAPPPNYGPPPPQPTVHPQPPPPRNDSYGIHQNTNTEVYVQVQPAPMPPTNAEPYYKPPPPPQQQYYPQQDINPPSYSQPDHGPNYPSYSVPPVASVQQSFPPPATQPPRSYPVPPSDYDQYNSYNTQPSSRAPIPTQFVSQQITQPPNTLSLANPPMGSSNYAESCAEDTIKRMVEYNYQTEQSLQYSHSGMMTSGAAAHDLKRQRRSNG